jgi:hypothetical protein
VHQPMQMDCRCDTGPPNRAPKGVPHVDQHQRLPICSPSMRLLQVGNPASKRRQGAGAPAPAGEVGPLATAYDEVLLCRLRHWIFAALGRTAAPSATCCCPTRYLCIPGMRGPKAALPRYPSMALFSPLASPFSMITTRPVALVVLVALVDSVDAGVARTILHGQRRHRLQKSGLTEVGHASSPYITRGGAIVSAKYQ